MPESTLSRLLRPETIHPDICRIKVETKSQTVDTLHNVITEGSVKPPPEDKAYLIKGKALETVFAKRSTPENQLSFNLLKKSDETRIYYMVEIRSKKFLENCTAKVMPITGREKQNEMVEYDTSWDGRLNMSTIDLNP
ncbi:MAG: hypothetical protein ACRDFB_01575, partial [Rhabdochlamydiaceae bacterium]